MRHDGGYSTFRAEVTGLLAEENELTVAVDNSKNDRVYPQKADFTFYGGIYRDVSLLVVSKDHICAGLSGQLRRRRSPRPSTAQMQTLPSRPASRGRARSSISILDAAGTEVLTGKGSDAAVTHRACPSVGRRATTPISTPAAVRAEVLNGAVTGRGAACRFGVRSFHVDPQEGLLPQRPAPIPCTAFPAIRTARASATPSPGRCIDEDMAAHHVSWARTPSVWHTTSTTSISTTCATRHGMVVWAEIPYIC